MAFSLRDTSMKRAIVGGYGEAAPHSQQKYGSGTHYPGPGKLPGIVGKALAGWNEKAQVQANERAWQRGSAF